LQNTALLPAPLQLYLPIAGQTAVIHAQACIATIVREGLATPALVGLPTPYR